VRTRVAVTLGTAQLIAWAGTYYLPAIVSRPIARELGVPPFTVDAAFAVALLSAAAVTPFAGRAVDGGRGRAVLAASAVVIGGGLTALAFADGVPSLIAAWLLIGVGMGCGLYEAAFATAVRLFGSGSRGAIAGITVCAGFASTVGWPLSAWILELADWRHVCLAWAAAQVLVNVPLYLSVPRTHATDAVGRESAATAIPLRGPAVSASDSGRTAVLLGIVFATTWFTSTALAAHLPGLFAAAGATAAAAIAAAALVGPSQVAGRLLEVGPLQRWHPLRTARIAALAHPAASVVLLVFGASGTAWFAVLHGLGNGVLTVAMGTLPLALFGPGAYGERQGYLMIPARLAQASAPLVFGFAVQQAGVMAIGVTLVLTVASMGALLVLPTTTASRTTPASPSTGEASAPTTTTEPVAPSAPAGR
jgi:predicted MFS family arabinose efflux permease